MSRNPMRCSGLSRFELNSAIPLLKRKGYTKAMRELEMILNIHNDISLFK